MKRVLLKRFLVNGDFGFNAGEPKSIFDVLTDLLLAAIETTLDHLTAKPTTEPTR